MRELGNGKTDRVQDGDFQSNPWVLLQRNYASINESVRYTYVKTRVNTHFVF